MKKENLTLHKALTVLAVVGSAGIAKADGVTEAISEMGDMATAVAAGAAAVIGVAVVFAMIKLGKRLLGKV